MDPTAALQRIYDADDKDEATAACEDLAGWLRRGGFRPDLTKVKPHGHGARRITPWYWPGTNTRWGILTEPAHAPRSISLRRYDGIGELVESYELGEIPAETVAWRIVPLAEHGFVPIHPERNPVRWYVKREGLPGLATERGFETPEAAQAWVDERERAL